jgi:hypothetical protein
LSYAALCVKDLMRQIAAGLIETGQWHSARMMAGPAAPVRAARG